MTGADMGLSDEIIDLRPLVTRQMVWDMSPHDNTVLDVLRELELVPGTQEGLDIEHRESDERLNAVLPLADLVRIYAAIASEVFGALEFHPVDSEDEEQAEMIKGLFLQQNYEVVFAGAMAVISQLIRIGILQPGGNYGVLG